jgi:hypothetical protein
MMWQHSELKWLAIALPPPLPAGFEDRSRLRYFAKGLQGILNDAALLQAVAWFAKRVAKWPFEV